MAPASRHCSARSFGEVALDTGTLDTPPKDRQGYMPAVSGSWASLTVKENLDFVGGIYGVHGTELVARRTALLERAGLTDARDRLASKLSGGMRRKLGFCMAMLHSPALLVLDEPSTGVDPVSRVELWRLVAEAAAGGAAVIVSTSYLDEAERASRLVALDEGRVLVEGSYDDIRLRFRGVVTESGDRCDPSGRGAADGVAVSSGPMPIRPPGARSSSRTSKTSSSRCRSRGAPPLSHERSPRAGGVGDTTLWRPDRGGPTCRSGCAPVRSSVSWAPTVRERRPSSGCSSGCSARARAMSRCSAAPPTVNGGAASATCPRTSASTEISRCQRT